MGTAATVFPALIALSLVFSSPCFGDTYNAQLSTPLQAERTVKPGDRVQVHYLCRLKSGDVVASTDSIAGTEKKSPIFVSAKDPGPVSIQAINRDEPLPDQLWPGPFESEIRVRIARLVTGMKEGESKQVELSAKMIPGISEKEGFTWLAKVRTRPKVMTMPKGDYEFRARKAPEVGQSYFYDPAFPGNVESVTDTDVIIRFTAKLGDTIETPFGQGRIREEGDNYKVDIDAREGTLVRTGSKIGRITKVDDKVITLDYRHPFGYEELVCDVTVVTIVEEHFTNENENAPEDAETRADK